MTITESQARALVAEWRAEAEAYRKRGANDATRLGAFSDGHSAGLADAAARLEALLGAEVPARTMGAAEAAEFIAGQQLASQRRVEAWARAGVAPGPGADPPADGAKGGSDA